MKEKFEQEQKDNHNHIEDLTMDMPDMEDDEKFRQWLEETYINEAELIEKSLLAGQEYEKNLDIAEELSVPREKFYQRLKEEGLYEDEADDTSELAKKAVRGVGTEIAGDAVAKKNNDSVSRTAGEKIISMEARTSKEAGRAEKAVADKVVSMEPESSKEAGTAARATEGSQSSVKTETSTVSDIGVSSEKSSKNDHPVRKKRSYLRLGKIAGVAGVCLLCVFAASMTSEANRNYLVNTVRILSGKDSKFISYNDTSNEDSNMIESEAYTEIENKLNVKMPEFFYRPYGMEFMSYEISALTSAAKVEYKYNNRIFILFVDTQNENTASNINGIHGEKGEVITLNVGDDEITVERMDDAEEKEPNYVAQWSRDDTNYVFSGRLEWDELKKMLEQMKF